MPVCPDCGAFCDADHNFCTECGARLIKPEPSQDTEQQSGWQDRYQQYRPSYGGQYRQYQQERQNTLDLPETDGTPVNSGRSLCTVSLIFGILGFVCCFFPVFSTVGLVTGILGIKKSGAATAKVGLILSIISLALFTTALIITAINGFDFSALHPNNLINMLGSLY